MGLKGTTDDDRGHLDKMARFSSPRFSDDPATQQGTETDPDKERYCETSARHAQNQQKKASPSSAARRGPCDCRLVSRSRSPRYPCRRAHKGTRLTAACVTARRAPPRRTALYQLAATGGAARNGGSITSCRVTSPPRHHRRTAVVMPP